MNEPVLQLHGATKTYRHGSVDVAALRGVDLEVEAGSLTAVMGPSGSGKSTLLHLAAGMVGATSGLVRVAGMDLADRSPAELAELRRHTVGVVFQQYNLVPSLTALENVTLPLELDGGSQRAVRDLGRAALERVGVEEPFSRYPDDLSGGQQQRVAIARAVAVPRKVILADEPTGALDTLTGDRILELFRQLADDGAAVLIVTHEPRVAGFADRVVTIRDGRRAADTVVPVPPDLSMMAIRRDTGASAGARTEIGA